MSSVGPSSASFPCNPGSSRIAARELPGLDGGAATGAELSGPSGATVDGSGNLVITDTGNNRIRVVAETTGTFYGQAMTAGDIYTVAGNGTAGFAGDGGPATGAELSRPEAAITDPAGDVLISDSGNGRIREVAG